MGNGNAVSSRVRSWLGLATEVRVLMVGLDAVGKTTLLYRLKTGECVPVIPTIGFNVESFPHGESVVFTVWEVGGGDKIRALWWHYYVASKAVIFVVDANDRDRLHEARDALHAMRAHPEVHAAPLLVLANKQDIPGAMSAAEVAVGLDVHELTMSAVAVLPIAGADGTGLEDALDWLTLQLTGRPTKRSHHHSLAT